jgi:hypothetical protein
MEGSSRLLLAAFVPMQDSPAWVEVTSSLKDRTLNRIDGAPIDSMYVHNIPQIDHLMRHDFSTSENTEALLNDGRRQR